MLATNRPWSGPTDGWAFEPEFDGWRAIVYVDSGVRIATRNGNDITDALPELRGLVDVLPEGGVVLDGEIVAGQGRAQDFYRLSPRLAARRPLTVAVKRRATPVTFVAFDVLWLGGSTINQPYAQLREQLEHLALNDDAWIVTPQLHGTVEALLAACAEHDVEGVVAKRLVSRYRPGEGSNDWRKIKTSAWRAHHAPLRHGRDAEAVGQ
jgi:bifunctional non-homologous end joining protein LigD